MMDTLYVESFSVKERISQAEEVKNKTIIESIPVESHEFNGQMQLYLDRLEREIDKEYRNFANFHFIFDKIRANLKKGDLLAIQVLLTDLEELLDIGLPAVLMRKLLVAERNS